MSAAVDRAAWLGHAVGMVELVRLENPRHAEHLGHYAATLEADADGQGVFIMPPAWLKRGPAGGSLQRLRDAGLIGSAGADELGRPLGRLVVPCGAVAA